MKREGASEIPMEPTDAARAVADKRRQLAERLSNGIAALAKGAPTVRTAPADPRHFEPFPLTDMQEAYWLGRQAAFELGGTSIHSYRESELEDLDLARLEAAWWQLVQRHAALRSVVTEAGMQRVVADPPPYRIALADLSAGTPEAIAAALDATRREMSHRMFPLDAWPQWEIRASKVSARSTRLHIGFDGMLIDDRSYQILIHEWLTLYRDAAAPLPPLAFSFRDFVLAERAQRDTPAYEQALRYWRARVATLPASAELPLRKSFKQAGARFERYRYTLDKARWARLKALCQEQRVTPAGLLLSCFMEVLGRWSKQPELTVSVPTLNRPPFHPHINDIVGDFGSFILVGNDGATAQRFVDRVTAIQQRLWDGLDNDCVSGVRILRELAQQRKAGSSVQMPIVFTMASAMRHAPAAPTVAKGENIGVLYGITQTPQVFLDHQAAEMQQALHFNWDVIEELFPEGLMPAMFSAYCELLERLAADAGVLDESSPVDIPAEQRRERERANATDAPIADLRLHEISPREAAPQRPAVVQDERTLSYAELAARADTLARRLVREGVRANELVAILADKGWQQVVAARAILAAGAAYLPVAADLPADYRERLFERAGARVVLTETAHWPVAAADGRTYLSIEDECRRTAEAHAAEVLPRAAADHLAYVIFTSGSTGDPKGVMITHRSAVNTVLDVNSRYGVGANDCLLGISSLSFDLSVYDLFGAFAAGATLAIPAPGKSRDAAYLLQLMHARGVTVWNSVPALMEMLVQHAEDTGTRLPASLRLVLLSGDWIPVSLPARIRARGGDVRVISLGGATEAAIWSIHHPIGAVRPDWPSIPYGTPLANQRFHVLDGADRDCPVWVPGRLCIEGEGLAVGYWDAPLQTAQRFRTRAGTNVRVYETGDFGRYRPGGLIEFLGREDRQVKIHGYRIELDEIESQLARHPAIVRAVVVKTATNQLRAFVVTRDAACTAAVLAQHLAAHLPAYMVPPLFQFLDELPLTANGKVDHAALQRTTQEADAPAAPAPTDRRAQRLLEDIRGVLQLDAVDTRRSLIELGANSLEIVRISNRVRAYAEGHLKLEDYFAARSVDELLTAFAGAAAPAPAGPTAAARPALRAPAASAGPLAQVTAGVRGDLSERPAVQLLREPERDPAPWDKRRSHRQFSLRPIGFPVIGRWLQPLASSRAPVAARYRYASAGGLYTVQTYLYVKRGRVSGLLGGSYYYHPDQHRLVELEPAAVVDRLAYGEQNRPAFDQAALCIFLVCPLDAVEAHYGEWGYDAAMYEAGSIGQLLREAAVPLGLGACSVGTLDFARIRAALHVDQRHLLLHSFVGGAVDNGADGAAEISGSDFERAAALLQRIGSLSEADAEHLANGIAEGE